MLCSTKKSQHLHNEATHEWYHRCGTLPVTVTTRIITCLVGDPETKPWCATITGRGPHPSNHWQPTTINIINNQQPLAINNQQPLTPNKNLQISSKGCKSPILPSFFPPDFRSKEFNAGDVWLDPLSGRHSTVGVLWNTERCFGVPRPEVVR